MHDRLPDDIASLNWLTDLLSARAGSQGYRMVDPPVLEHTELFLRKSGGERVAQLYSFDHRGRQLALRPEFTASVVRLFIDAMQSDPLPIRLMYAGPVFRYENPQAGRTRQFTEFGCELIGAGGPVADAEVLRLAIDGLQLTGVERPRLVLGHIGVVIGFLASLDLDQRTQDWLTWSMERLRKGDKSSQELPPHLLATSELPEQDVDTVLADGDELRAETVARVLRQAGVALQGGSRTPEEIVRGLFAKRRRQHDQRLLEDASTFVSQLTELAGPPREVIGPLRELVASRGLDQTQLDDLEQIIELLTATGYDPDDIRVDLGMGRGLHYYTGILFEMYDAAFEGPQLCGGGRYDDLAQLLGARQPVPACGFSYGLERVLAAGRPNIPANTRPGALVLQDGNPAGAMRLAAEFRAAGWLAAVDLRDRNLSATRRAAQRQGYDVLVVMTRSGVQITRLSDGADTTCAVVPRPDEVLPK